jgi:hypothetical protein
MKYDVDSIVTLLDSAVARDNILQLMCTKVGFFPTIEIDAQVLKYIIASFPYIIRNKGTKLGIEYAVNAILKAENTPDSLRPPLIFITNCKENQPKYSTNNYNIEIYTNVKDYNYNALKELLAYVVPAGYTYKITSYSKATDENDTATSLLSNDSLKILKVRKDLNTQIRSSLSHGIDNGAPTIIGNFETMELATSLNKIDVTNGMDGIAEIYPSKENQEKSN